MENFNPWEKKGRGRKKKRRGWDGKLDGYRRLNVPLTLRHCLSTKSVRYTFLIDSTFLGHLQCCAGIGGKQKPKGISYELHRTHSTLLTLSGVSCIATECFSAVSELSAGKTFRQFPSSCLRRLSPKENLSMRSPLLDSAQVDSLIASSARWKPCIAPLITSPELRFNRQQYRRR
jgi:hypothetical protein